MSLRGYRRNGGNNASASSLLVGVLKRAGRQVTKPHSHIKRIFIGVAGSQTRNKLKSRPITLATVPFDSVKP